MVNKITPDKRPALAFDSQLEVNIIKTALRFYKDKIATPKGNASVLRVTNLIDELEKVEQMFNTKE